MPPIVTQIDAGILLFIQNNLRSSLLTQVCEFLSSYGVIVMAVYFVIMLIWDKRKIFPIASACVVGGLMGQYITSYLKHLVKRPRPFLEISALVPLHRSKSYSFPSGHTVLAFSVAFIAYRILQKKYSIPALCIAALVAFSRLYMGVHYPTDILGGICIGYLVGFITEFLYKR